MMKHSIAHLNRVPLEMAENLSDFLEYVSESWRERVNIKLEEVERSHHKEEMELAAHRSCGETGTAVMCWLF